MATARSTSPVTDRLLPVGDSTAPLDEADADDLARVFAALADPVRLRLLSLIAEARRGLLLRPARPARQVPADHLPPHQGPRRSRPDRREKRGRWIWWRIVPERLDAIRLALAAASRG